MFQTEKKYKLPKELGEYWCNLLNSGEYTQAVKLLYTDVLMEHGKVVGGEAYCPIGLLIAKYFNVPVSVLNGKRLVSSEYIKKTFGVDVPQEVIDIVIMKNDEEGYSFPQLRYWIKQNCEFIR